MGNPGKVRLRPAILALTAMFALVPAAPASFPPLPLPEAGPPVSAVPPTISGGTSVGQTVNCSTGAWTNTYADTTYSFAWQRSGSAISGQTSSFYTLGAGDVTQPITCTVTAKNVSAAAPNSATSLPSLPIIPVSLPVPTPPVPTAAPSITPVAASPGETLTCNTGTWTSATSFVYSWQSNGSDISGVSGQTYTIASGDLGNAITCTVKATGSGGTTSATSQPVIPIPSAPSGPPGSGGSSGGDGTGGGSTGGSTGGSSGSSGVGSTGGSSGNSGGGSTGGGKGGGASAPPPVITPKGPAPVLSTLTVSPRKVLVTVRGSSRRTKGVSIRFSLNRSASVLIFVVQVLPHGKTRIAAVLGRKAGAGTNQMPYNLRARHGVLGPGNYLVGAAAYNNGAWSVARISRFSVALKHVKVHHAERKTHRRKHR